MKRIYTIIIISLFCTNYTNAEIISQQDFESVPILPTLGISSNVDGIFYSGILSGGRPSDASQFVSSSRSIGVSNGTAILTFDNINTIDYTNISATFKLSSLSINGTNGADGSDDMMFSVSPDGGATWYNQIEVSGNSDACWSFSDGLIVASRDYSTALETTITASYTEYNSPLDGISTIRVDNLPSINNLKFRITLSNNGINERWLVDDFIVTGDLNNSSNPVINYSKTLVTGLSYAFNSVPSSIDTFRVFADSLVPEDDFIGLKSSANFEISTSAIGPFSDTLTLAYIDSSLTSTIIYVRMISGLSVNEYTGAVTASGGGAIDKYINLKGIVTAGPCGDLIISEYVEGSGNNKYLEFYNPTPQPIILNSGGTDFYRIVYYSNGASSPTPINFLNDAIVPAYGTYVIGHGSGTIFNASDQIFGLPFNGDDAVSIQKNIQGIWQNIDDIGEIGDDPGTSWSVGGISTLNSTLVRKPSVLQGSLSS